MPLDRSNWPFSIDSCHDPVYRRVIVELAEKIETLIFSGATVGELSDFLRLEVENAD